MLLGQDPLTFYDVTVLEIDLILTAARKRDARIAWMTAQYMRFAYHQPNEMPEDPAFERVPGENREADVVYVKAWMKAMAAKNGD